MRVLMTADAAGGVWTYALELARALAGEGVELVIATMGPPLSPAQWHEARGVQVHESRFRLEWMENPWKDVEAAGRWLLDLEQQLRPDVVHLNGYAHGALPWRAPALVVAHSCVLSWWQAVKGEPAPASWNCYREAVSKGIGAVPLVIAPTAAMLAETDRYYDPLSRAAVIPNARDACLFPPGVKEPFVFAAGRLWDEGKNLPALDEAAERSPWPVYIAGGDRSPDGATRSFTHARELGPLPAVDIANWLGRASIYALPARYEPFGLSVLEAALAGCTLVLGDIPSLRENWEGAAEFVPAHDPAALRETIARLACDPSQRALLAAESRSRALTYTPRRMAEAYAAAYRSLAAAAR